MPDTNKNHQNKHIPVLLDAVLQELGPRKGEKYLDLTAGYGGHASVILEKTMSKDTAVLVDRDQNAIKHLQQLFPGNAPQIIQKDFLSASKDLLQQNRKFDLILADLGVSSPHLDEASRGFSFRSDGPLDMRMDEQQSLSAEIIVNSYDEERLADVIFRYGEEHRAKKIARAIIESRPITSTTALANVIAKVTPGYSKTHPATKTFQALRLVVNSELEQIEQALPVWIELLKPGGRVAVISFHSLEDRIVKQAFQKYGGNDYEAVLTVQTKRPLTASPTELVLNPRARSAKLRVAVKK